MAAKYNLYRNLHKLNMASVQHKGLVIDHIECALLTDCTFAVSEKRRVKVTQEFKKNVHAVVKAANYKKGDFNTEEFEELYYNPYFTQYFYCIATGQKCLRAREVIFKNNKVYAKGITSHLI